MTSLEEAKAHMEKSREFLDAAIFALELKMFNAATSSAVSSGINSKDAICLKLTGRTLKTENHATAANELKQAGPAAATLAITLERLLGLRARAQYQASSVGAANAAKAVEWAGRLHASAKEIVVS